MLVRLRLSALRNELQRNTEFLNDCLALPPFGNIRFSTLAVCARDAS